MRRLGDPNATPSSCSKRVLSTAVVLGAIRPTDYRSAGQMLDAAPAVAAAGTLCSVSQEIPQVCVCVGFWVWMIVGFTIYHVGRPVVKTSPMRNMLYYCSTSELETKRIFHVVFFFQYFCACRQLRTSALFWVHSVYVRLGDESYPQYAAALFSKKPPARTEQRAFSTRKT